MRYNFKYIVIGFIISLALVFVWQLFWLKGLYNTINADSEQTVVECINSANLYELQLRMDSLDNEPKQGSSITITQTLNDDDDNKEEKKGKSGNEGRGLKKTKKIVNKNDTTTTVTNEEGDRSLTIQMLQKLVFSFTESVHQALDSIAPINLHRVDSMLSVNFEERGIRANVYGIEIVNQSTGSVHNSLIKDSLSVSSSQSFDFKYDTENNLAYRVHMQPLTKTVLAQMSGILGTTLLIILILSIAFWYLIRTVIQQRTLEEMKDDFTNNMTHELKTPIAVAYSAADALLNFKQGENKEKRDRYLTICKNQLGELSALVEQILSMSMERRKTFVLNKEDIPIESLLQILIEQHKLKASKEVCFSVDLSPQDITINADRTHINNIISNLLDNAIKYSKESVEIKITAEMNEKVCTLTVADNGIGIHPEKLKYIFEKFYRVTSGNQYNMKGYGLGLFYVKTMVEKHGGTISVKSTPHIGSVFTIVIPIH